MTVGQKTHPYGFRLGFNKPWSSRWFAKGPDYARLIHEDLKMKKAIKEKYFHAGIAGVDVERVGRLLGLEQRHVEQRDDVEPGRRAERHPLGERRFQRDHHSSR